MFIMLGATKHRPEPRSSSQGDEETATYPIAQATLVLVHQPLAYLRQLSQLAPELFVIARVK